MEMIVDLLGEAGGALLLLIAVLWALGWTQYGGDERPARGHQPSSSGPKPPPPRGTGSAAHRAQPGTTVITIGSPSGPIPLDGESLGEAVRAALSPSSPEALSVDAEAVRVERDRDAVPGCRDCPGLHGLMDSRFNTEALCPRCKDGLAFLLDGLGGAMCGACGGAGQVNARTGLPLLPGQLAVPTPCRACDGTGMKGGGHAT